MAYKAKCRSAQNEGIVDSNPDHAIRKIRFFNAFLLSGKREVVFMRCEMKLCLFPLPQHINGLGFDSKHDMGTIPPSKG